uniref:Uncharacterized protein n=1 Tax=Avena sativa TaxID=4498 RepID=A0ACD5X318_AVESA
MGIWWLDHLNYDFMGMLEDFSAFPTLRGLFCWMQSYFDACSDELKPCIFYMSVFPADQKELGGAVCSGDASRRVTHLVVVVVPRRKRGKKLFSELTGLSILYEKQEGSAMRSYKLNGFFHEYIKSRPMEDNLVFALEGSYSRSSQQLTGQHLTVSSSWERDKYVLSMIDLSRLRSLTVFGTWESFLISDKMKRLRVLDLEGTSTSPRTMSVTDNDLVEIGKVLPRLKFLSLRGCMTITCLPNSMVDMRQLQTLDVRYTSIVELPSTITKLENLRYIRAGTGTDTSLLLLESQAETSMSPPRPQEDGPFRQATTSARLLQLASTRMTNRNKWWKLKNQPDLRIRHRVAANGGGVELGHAAAEGVGRLTHLHTLGVVNVAGGKGALLFLEELKKLTQLRKLGLSGINRNNWSHLCDAISGNLHHLESLSLQLMLLGEDVGRFHFACFDNMPEPPKTLKRLKVLYPTTGLRAAYAARIPQGWLKKLPNLQRFLRDLTISSQEDILIMKEGVSLIGGCSLCIKPIEDHLSFEKMAQDTSASCDARLDSLRIECSSTLSHAKIAGLHKLPRLKEVTVTGTYADHLKQDLHEQINNHPNKPVLK